MVIPSEFKTLAEVTGRLAISPVYPPLYFLKQLRYGLDFFHSPALEFVFGEVGESHHGIPVKLLPGLRQFYQTLARIPGISFLIHNPVFLHGRQQACDTGRGNTDAVGQISAPHHVLR